MTRYTEILSYECRYKALVSSSVKFIKMNFNGTLLVETSRLMHTIKSQCASKTDCSGTSILLLKWQLIIGPKTENKVIGKQVPKMFLEN